MKYSGIALICFFTMAAISCVQAGAAYDQLATLDMEKIQFRELYAVEYRSYMKEAVGAVTINNQTNEDLQAIVVLGGKKYINAPMEITAPLPAKQKTDIPLYIDLDIAVLDLGRRVEQVPISIEVSAYLGKTEIFRSDAIAKYVALHDRHEIPDGDPSKIAMFVDPGDKHILSEISADMGGTDATEEDKAAAAFKFLQKKGIYCVGSGGLQVQYPRELLRMRLGSIHDGSLLYVAILESLGVETKLVFNSDGMLPLYKYQEKWHPVDLNMLADDFHAARSSGEKLRSIMLAKDAHTVALREAWDKYPPLRFPVLASEDMPLFKLASGYVEQGELEDAATTFDQLLSKYPNNPVLLNNAGNVHLLMGNTRQAVEKYSLAVARAPDDGGLYLNMGIAYHRMGNEAKSIELIGKARTKLGSYVAMRNMLSLDKGDAAYKEIDNLLRQASRSAGISSVALAARSLAKSPYPLYWKRFHG